MCVLDMTACTLSLWSEVTYIKKKEEVHKPHASTSNQTLKTAYKLF